MAKSVKLADIAKCLGVSNVTVSKALSGQKGVSEELREKIRSLADEMGYQQPSAQRREKMEQIGKGCNIGVLVSECYLGKYDSFYWQMYQQVATSAVTEGSFTLMEVIGEQAEEKKETPKLILEKKADGIIVMGKLSDGYLEFLKQKAKIPLIYLDFCDEKQEIDAVISDSYYGAYRLTNYLFAMGHTQIAFVGTLLATAAITDRYLGYTKALLEHGLQIKEEWVIDGRELESGKINGDGTLALPEDMPTAFVCSCDLTAGYLIKKLQEAGYQVPQDVSVVGYDNYLFPGFCNVSVTTYEVDVEEMAHKAICTLMKRIRGERQRPGICMVEGSMVLKGSVKELGNEVSGE